MSFITFLLLSVFAMSWCVGGLSYYDCFEKTVRRFPQRIVLVVIAGPIVWLSFVLIPLFKFVYNVFAKLNEWMTKS